MEIELKTPPYDVLQKATWESKEKWLMENHKGIIECWFDQDKMVFMGIIRSDGKA
jgi:hypothetical protein